MPHLPTCGDPYDWMTRDHTTEINGGGMASYLAYTPCDLLPVLVVIGLETKVHPVIFGSETWPDSRLSMLSNL